MGRLISKMILVGMADCLLIPSLVQSTPWQPHPYADSPYASYGAPPITYNQKKYQPTEPSYEVPKYQPTEPSYEVPKEYKPSESYGKIEPVSPLKTCTLPAGVFYNDSLIVCGSGCQAIG